MEQPEQKEEKESEIPLGASESLHLELELEDSEKVEEGSSQESSSASVIDSSQKGPTASEKLLAKRLAVLAKLNLDTTVLQAKPKLGGGGGDFVIEEDGIDLFKNRCGIQKYC